MKKIFKYELKPRPTTNLVAPVMMPHDAKYLHVGAQGDQMFIGLRSILNQAHLNIHLKCLELVMKCMKIWALREIT